MVVIKSECRADECVSLAALRTPYLHFHRLSPETHLDKQRNVPRMDLDGREGGRGRPRDGDAEREDARARFCQLCVRRRSRERSVPDIHRKSHSGSLLKPSLNVCVCVCLSLSDHSLLLAFPKNGIDPLHKP